MQSRLQSHDFVAVTSQDSKSALRIIVSKKVAKRAVDRNRIKRIIKEAIRGTELIKNLSTIIVKNNIANKKTKEVQVDLIKLTNDKKDH